MNKHLKTFIFTIGLPALLGIVIIAYIQPEFAYAGFKQHDHKELSEEEQRETVSVSHKEITGLMEQFMNQIVQEIDEDYKVVHYQTKDELLDTFEKISTREVAITYVDFYFTEKDDGLYLLPTETPPWFIPENDYDVIQLNWNKVMVEQYNQLDLYGDYTIQVELTYIDGAWKITNITHS